MDAPRKVLLYPSNEPPVLSLHNGQKWHVFLSHNWSSGQDQCSVIKRQLQLLLPGIKVFLDVDDREFHPRGQPTQPRAQVSHSVPRPVLSFSPFCVCTVDDNSRLEEYVSTSQCTLTFLSKGYFFSRRCNRELQAALALEKPLCLVHEADVKHGGSPLDSLRNDCPESMRSLFFRLEEEGGGQPEREVISWLHTSAFQLVSLRMIAKTILWSTPLYNDSNPLIYVGGELGFKELVFPRPIVLYASASNPGAAEVATEILNRFDDANVSITLRRPPVIKGSRTSQSIVDVASPSVGATSTMPVASEQLRRTVSLQVSELPHTASSPFKLPRTASSPSGFGGCGQPSSTRNSRRSSDPSVSSEESNLMSEDSVQAPGLRRTTSNLVRALNATELIIHEESEVGLAESSRSISSRRGDLRRSSSSLVTALKVRTPMFGPVTSWAVDKVDSIRQRLKGSPGEATHMLLYLNARTFKDTVGSTLAREVRAAHRARLPIIIIHENGVTFDGADFETYARPTRSSIVYILL